MSALGLMLIGAGVLTVWSGLDRVIVTDVLRSIIGAPIIGRSSSGALPPPKTA